MPFVEGMSPVMGVMIKVKNADEAVEKIRSLGGKAAPAGDVADNGRMAVCHDPNGGTFDIWEPKTMPGTDVDSSHPGAPSWSQTLTTDMAKAKELYRSLFGWTAEVKQMPGMEHTVLRNKGTDIAGLMAISYPDLKPHWSTYFTVNDAEEAAETAKERDGTLCVPPMNIPEIGRSCGIISPQDVRFYAIRYLPRQGS